MLATTERYVAAWLVLGGLALGVVLLTLGLPAADPVLVGAMVGVLALGEGVELDFRFERARAAFTLIEVAITAALLLLPVGYAVLTAVIGTALARLLHRGTPLQVLFNIGHVAVGTSLAGLIAAALPSFGPTVGDRPVFGVVIGMGGYAVVNLGAMIGLFRRYSSDDSAGLRAQVPLTAAMIAGQVATGVVFAAIATLQPALLVFVIAPAAAVYLAGQGSRRTGELLSSARAERDRLNRIVDGASDGIVLLDGEGRIQVWNPAMARLTGLSDEEVLGEGVAAVLDDRTRLADEPVRGRWLIDAAHEGPTRRERDAVLVHRDGTRRHARESHALVYDDRGRCTGDVVVVHDVSRQRELERLRSDFVARVSHELRTPLTPIRGFARVLLQRGAALTPEQRTDALERILDRSEHLGDLVEDLLLVTRLDRGELDDVANPRPMDIAPPATRAVENARTRDPGRPFTLDVAPGTPLALADPARVERILDALLDNASRYTPDDSSVEIHAGSEGDDVIVEVTDHGPGIPRDRSEVVFERFQRLEDPLTMRSGGVGLGLFLARSLATAMHGSLELADPHPGGGATFVLHLPTAEPVRDTGTRVAG